MSTILKEVLGLTSRHESYLWRVIEQRVIDVLPGLNTHELVKITNHFGKNSQGTNALWRELDSSIVKAFPNLTADQTLSLINGFGEAPPGTYELSEQLDQLLSISWEYLGKISLMQMQESDPYFSSNIMNTFNAGGALDWQRHCEQLFSRCESNEIDFISSKNTTNQSLENTAVTDSSCSQVLTEAERDTFIKAELAQFEKMYSKHGVAIDLIRSN